MQQKWKNGGVKRRRSSENGDAHQNRSTNRSPNTHVGAPRDDGTTADAASSSSRLYHPFKANFNDHFETSRAALDDLLPAITELRQLMRPSSPELFTIYDPYYCSGTIVGLWRQLGIGHVLHENRDFYADIANNTVPGPYDVVVTNPPFSEDHMERMLHFLVRQGKPWAFLAPDYIAAKDWYKRFVQKHFSPAPLAVKGNIHAPRGGKPVVPPAVLTPPPFLAARLAQEAAGGAAPAEGGKPDVGVVGPEPFYIVPRVTYDFVHPVGAGKAHSHFKSMWYVWAGRRTAEVIRGTRVTLLHNAAQANQAAPAVVHGLIALEQGHHVAATEKRVNPKRRSKLNTKRRHGGTS